MSMVPVPTLLARVYGPAAGRIVWVIGAARPLISSLGGHTVDPVGLLGLLFYTVGVFTFGALFILWLRSAMGWGRQVGAPAVVGPVDRVEGIFLFVCFLWFVLNLLFTFSAVGPGLDRNLLNIAIFAMAFLFPLWRSAGSGSGYYDHRHRGDSSPGAL